MADEQTISNEVIEKAETEIGAGFWGGEKPAPAVTDTVVVDKDKTAVVDTGVTEENKTAIPIEWLKTEFDIGDPAILKAEREELKILKANTPKAESITFADDQSKHIHELLREGKTKEVKQFLETQEQLSEFATVEVNKENAEDIIKLQMKLVNKQLTNAEINFQYKQNYTTPKEPVQKENELDEDFTERHNDWKEIAADIEMKRVIAAKMAQPELNKLKAEIVLPEIAPKENKSASTKQPTQEELDNAKKDFDSFNESVDSSLKTLNEIGVMVKDEAVQIPVSYVFSPEEKLKVAEQLKTFASNNYDANAILAPRWINQDGTMNVSRMARDLARLNADDKIDQKLASDGASKRLSEYTKQKKNIQLQGVHQSSGNGAVDANKALEEVEAAIWSR